MTTNRDSQTIVNELVALLRLTRTEAQIARVRVGQARREEIRQELKDNAREADARAARLQEALRRLGGTPDIFADAVGRVTALTKATAEQAQPFSEGLLGDLALEHQLRDRVVFTRVLAEAQNETTVAKLMHDLEEAHTETIEWIRVRLAEIAQGGPAALAPTPAQAAIGTATRIVTLPLRQYAALVNKAVEALQSGRGATKQAVGSTVKKAQQTVQATGEVVGAGRDAALARAEQVAPSAQVRSAVHESRKNLGVVDPDELPVKEYDTLSVQAAIKEINDLQDAEDIRVVLRYEQAHKDRNGVSVAAQKRLTELAEESVIA